MRAPGKSLYRVTGTDGRPGWIHQSERAGTVKLRWWVPGNAPDAEPGWGPARAYRLPREERALTEILRSADPHTLADVTARTVDADINPAHEIRLDDGAQWKRVLDRLEELGPEGATSPTASRRARRPEVNDGSQAPRIPITRMRRFYETLTVLGASVIEKDLARRLSAESAPRWELLARYFQESVSHFLRYDVDMFANADDGFCPPLRPSRKAYVHRPNKFANCLAARWMNTSRPISGLGGKFRAVDYEISPLRTTGHAQLEDGKAGTSGSGGLDLLLVDEETGRLVIGEIKAATDRSIFFALIQSLTYVIELTSRAQALRLRRCYPDHFSRLPITAHGCKCDIMLICEARDRKLKLAEETKRLSRLLMTHDAFRQKIDRILLVSADLGDDIERIELKGVVIAAGVST